MFNEAIAGVKNDARVTFKLTNYQIAVLGMSGALTGAVGIGIPADSVDDLKGALEVLRAFAPANVKPDDRDNVQVVTMTAAQAIALAAASSFAIGFGLDAADGKETNPEERVLAIHGMLDMIEAVTTLSNDPGKLDRFHAFKAGLLSKLGLTKH